MEAAGIMIKTEKGYYDRFRGRIMFPIRNVSGATVGYSGRILPSLVDPTVAQGKYVNTPETALYHKSKILFGYDTAKKEMAHVKSVVVVEGQMDLCMSYQSGIHNTVAVSGTAFTDEHINLIKRFCDTVVLSFDMDSAGQSALKKTALLCLLGGLDVYAVENIGTKDPADLIRENPLSWKESIDKKRHIIEVMLSEVLDTEKDPRSQGKRIVSEVLPFVRAVQSPIDRSHFIRSIGEKSGIPTATLMEELSRGVLAPQEQPVKENLTSIKGKERLVREMIAYATLHDKLADEEFIALAIDTSQFPEAIIQEEMFKLEERLTGDKDQYFKDLAKAYKRELHKEEMSSLQEKLRAEGADAEDILKKIYELAKRGQ
jgi:DNA primase